MVKYPQTVNLPNNFRGNMFWFILFLILLVVIFMVIKAGKNKNTLPKNVASVSQKRYVERDGKLMEADGVFDAWTSGDLKAMIAQLKQKTTLVDRHFLLMNIVDQAYRNRDDVNGHFKVSHFRSSKLSHTDSF